MRLAARSIVLLAALAVALSAGCNRRLFRPGPRTCDSTTPIDVVVPQDRAADILIVVDNSGSMGEEQSELARNFINLETRIDPATGAEVPECPLTDLTDVPEDLRDPTPDKFAPGGPLADCGFIQLLAAYDNDFRVGVITSDVGLIDNRQGNAPAGWGNRPQRGCLQGDADARKVVKREDLEDGDPLNNALALRFASTLDNISVFGSPVERSLDAAAIFLDPASQRAPGCEGDLEAFRRPDEQLVVIFLSDEEDCSHAPGSSFPEELEGELAGEAPPPGDPTWASVVATAGGSCYARTGELTGVDRYRDAILAADPKAKIVVIGGLLPDPAAPDGFTAGSCVESAGALSASCWPSHGLSNLDDPGLACSALPVDDPQGINQSLGVFAGRQCTLDPVTGDATACALECCVADAGTRFLDFARTFVDDAGTRAYRLDSICKGSFRDTMLETAAFIAATNFVELAEAPASGVITVSIDDGTGEELLVPRIDAAACDSATGFYVEDEVRVVLCGDAVPRPGDSLKVRAKGTAETPECTAEASATP